MRAAVLLLGTVLIGIGAPVAAGEGAAGEHRRLLVEMEGDALRVIQVDRVATPLPKRRGPEHDLPWRFQVRAPDGRVIHSGRFEDPTLVRGEFHARDGSGRIEAVRVKRTGKAHFSLRVPAAGAERVVVQRLRAGTPRRRVQPESAWEQVGTLELGGVGGGR